MWCLIIILMLAALVTSIVGERGENSNADDEGSTYRIRKYMGTCFDEIFATACGVHVLEDTNESDAERRLIALASTNLWVKLSTMEAVQYVFRKSVLAALSSKMETSFHEVIREIFENIEKVILEDVELATLYRQEKSNAEQLPPLNAAQQNRTPGFGNLRSNTCFREFIVRISILMHAFIEPHTAYRSLSRAVFDLAKTPKGDEVQQIFDSAVKITARKIDIDRTQTDLSYAFDIGKILFLTLVELMETRPNLVKLFNEHGVQDIRLTTESISIAE